jgi:hypothetical protein
VDWNHDGVPVLVVAMSLQFGDGCSLPDTTENFQTGDSDVFWKAFRPKAELSKFLLWGKGIVGNSCRPNVLHISPR